MSASGTTVPETKSISSSGLSEARAKVFHRQSVDFCLREKRGPFLTDSGYAHAKVAYRACERKREEVEVVLPIVEENDFHIVDVIVSAVIIANAELKVQN